jgi:hypothetical protein
MDTKISLNLQITEDLKQKLEDKASTEGCTSEEAAIKILSQHFAASKKERKETAKKDSLPMVALIKNDFDKTVESDEPPVKNQTESFANQPFALIKSSAPISSSNEVTNEALTRKDQIEAQMKELSLLISTADEAAKKAEYSMQYALLATELDSIL